MQFVPIFPNVWCPKLDNSTPAEASEQTSCLPLFTYSTPVTTPYNTSLFHNCMTGLAYFQATVNFRTFSTGLPPSQFFLILWFGIWFFLLKCSTLLFYYIPNDEKVRKWNNTNEKHLLLIIIIIIIICSGRQSATWKLHWMRIVSSSGHSSGVTCNTWLEICKDFPPVSDSFFVVSWRF